MKGHALAEFIAHLPGTMNYRGRVSPEGPDGRVDIIVYKDELGFEPLIIKVQVKSTEGERWLGPGFSLGSSKAQSATLCAHGEFEEIQNNDLPSTYRVHIAGGSCQLNATHKYRYLQWF